MVNFTKSNFRMVSSLSAVVVVLITMIFSSTALAHDDGTYAYETDIGFNPGAWMTGLPDSMRLSEMSLIMTHDTMTYDLDESGPDGLPSVTQQMSLQKQLDSGIRAFDFRLKWDLGGYFKLYHALQGLDFKFRQVLDTLEDFLEDNPGETIVMSVLHELAAEGKDDETFNKEMDKAIKEYPDLFWKGTGKNPTLKDAREKIILMVGFDHSGFTFPGIELSDFVNGTEYKYLDTAEGFRDKWDDVKSHLATIKNDTTSDTLYLTGLNIATFGSHPWISASGHVNKYTNSNHAIMGFWIEDGYFTEFGRQDCWTQFWPPSHHVCDIYFLGMNNKAFWYIRENNMTRAGIVTIDFPGARLVNLFIKLNFQWTPDNTAPVADADSYSTYEDGTLTETAPYGVLSGDTDVNSGDTLTAVQDTDPDYGSLTLNSNGSFTYIPNANYCGSDSFTYHANDGTADSNVATVSITVNCVNDAPSFTKGVDQTVLEDAAAQSVANWATNLSTGPANESAPTQTLSFNVSNNNNALFSAQPNISPSGTLTYTSALNVFGSATVTVSVTDSGGTANGGVNTSTDQTFDIVITPVNDAPVAVDNNYTENEDTQLAGNVITDNTNEGVDSDVDGDGLSIFSNTDVSHGALSLSANGSFTYDPNENYCGPDSFDYVITDAPPATAPAMQSAPAATVSITVTCVNDPPVVTSVVDDAQISDYSDYINTVVITVEDVDDTSTTLLESDEPSLSSAGLSLSSTGCHMVDTESPDENGSTCTWDYDGQVKDPGDIAPIIVFTPSDEEAGTPGTHTLTIHSEDATVVLYSGNAVAVEVPVADGDSGQFKLWFFATETNDPDNAHDGTAEFGNLNEMVPFMTLVPVGPGGPVSGSCVFIDDLPVYPIEGYDQVALFECTFNEVPVNTYEIRAEVDGGSDTPVYFTGFDEGVFVVYDPSLGFTTGGGWFYWPGTDDPGLLTCGPDGYPGDKTNFGYNMKYNKKHTKVRGSLLMMRHTVDADCEGAGKYRVKSNALNGLAIGDGTDADGVDYGWAAFSGKSTFREPDLDNEGNHPFVVYVEDHFDEGGNQAPADEFWIEVKDKDGVVVLEVNGPDSDPAGLDEDTDGDDEPIENGNIVVPHSNKGKGKP